MNSHRNSTLRWLAIGLLLANVALYAWHAQHRQATLKSLPSDLQPLPEGTPGLELLSEQQRNQRANRQLNPESATQGETL